MLNIPHISWEDTQDPQGCGTNPEVYERYSRDPVRGPFQWNDQPHAGFSNTTGKTWLPVHPDYKTHNLAAQKASSHSHYTIYKQLTKLRQHPTFVSSNFESHVLNDDKVFAYKRWKDGESTFYIVINFDYTVQRVNLKPLGAATAKGVVEVSGVNSVLRNGNAVNLHDLQLGAYEVLVLKQNAKTTKSSASMAHVSLFCIVFGVMLKIFF